MSARIGPPPDERDADPVGRKNWQTPAAPTPHSVWPDSAADSASDAAQDRSLWASAPNRLLRPEEAAEYLALSRARIYELLASGQIESVNIGRSRRIPLAALDDFVNRLRAEGGCHSPRAS